MSRGPDAGGWTPERTREPEGPDTEGTGGWTPEAGHRRLDEPETGEPEAGHRRLDEPEETGEPEGPDTGRAGDRTPERTGGPEGRRARGWRPENRRSRGTGEPKGSEDRRAGGWTHKDYKTAV